MPIAILSLLTVLLGVAGSTGAQDYPKLAPYAAIRWPDEETPEVWFESRWQRLEAINDIPVADILEFSRERHRSRWQKRFQEDLVQVLTEMGHEPDERVDLTLLDEKGKARVFEDVRMTAENRQAILDGVNPEPLTKEQLREDLEHLLADLEQRHSYYRLKRYDLPAAIRKAQKELGDEVTRAELAQALDRLLAPLGDCHLGLDESADGYRPVGYLPFLCQDVEGGVAAFLPDRSGLVDDDYPYVAKLDGRDLDEWIEAASVATSHGSEHLVRARALRELRWVQWVRREMGLKETDTLRVTLQNRGGKKKRTVELDIAPRRGGYGPWPRPTENPAQILDDNTGYLRIATMSLKPPELARLIRGMESLEDTDALILDVRHNSGGRRDALLQLMPFFLEPDASPKVVNVAAYRLDAGDDPRRAEGYLDSRYLWPITADRWSDDERDVLERFARKFKPKWKLPKGQFSEWHYMAIGPSDDVAHYTKPVILLIDSVCFSATDIFAAAFKGHPNFTLMGTPTAGGSGRSREVTLPNSGLVLRASSMASFTPSGQLYDGFGVEPDVVILPVATDLIGETDTVLDAALQRLR